ESPGKIFCAWPTDDTKNPVFVGMQPPKKGSEPRLLACLPFCKAEPGKKCGRDKEDDSAKCGKRGGKRNRGEDGEYDPDQDEVRYHHPHVIDKDAGREAGQPDRDPEAVKRDREAEHDGGKKVERLPGEQGGEPHKDRGDYLEDRKTRDLALDEGTDADGKAGVGPERVKHRQPRVHRRRNYSRHDGKFKENPVGREVSGEER